MNRSIWIAPGAILTVGLIVCGLWGWQQAEAVVTLLGWEKRTIGAWSVRCAGAALISAAQAIAIALVVERVYRRDAVFAAVKLSAVMIYLLSSVCAIALGLAGR